MVNHSQERPLGELFSELSQGMSKMFRQEVELAKTELKSKAKMGARAGIYMVAAAVFFFGSFLVLLAAAVAALAIVLPVWAAALIIGALALGIGFTAVTLGISELKKGNLKPEHTMESLKENGKWLKEQI